MSQHQLDETDHLDNSDGKSKRTLDNNNGQMLIDKKLRDTPSPVQSEKNYFSSASNSTFGDNVVETNSYLKKSKKQENSVLRGVRSSSNEKLTDNLSKNSATSTTKDNFYSKSNTSQDRNLALLQRGRETGAIPKRKFTGALPSPLTIHPDEIISVPIGED